MMLYDIVWCFMVLYGVAWCRIVLRGVVWCCMEGCDAAEEFAWGGKKTSVRGSALCDQAV